jgi:DNA-binding transcriptional MocR family regulator
MVPAPEQLVFTGNGRRALPQRSPQLYHGRSLRREALTYPFIKGIAARLGISLVPLAMDEGGVRPDSVQKAHREAHLAAIYIQPAIQDPLGMTMTSARGPISCALSKAQPSDHRGPCLRVPRQ